MANNVDNRVIRLDDDPMSISEEDDCDDNFNNNANENNNEPFVFNAPNMRVYPYPNNGNRSAGHSAVSVTLNEMHK